MATASTSPDTFALASFDCRPFFDKALRYGVEQGILPPERLQIIQADFAKGIVQIANYFGTAHLRPELELALHRMVNLMSLHLEDMSAGDVQVAARSLRENTLLSHSKSGAEMLKRLHAMPDSTMLARGVISLEDQRAYLDEKTAAESIPLAEYRSEFTPRQENQGAIDFALWLAKRMGASRDDIDDADSLIRSAMLVLSVDGAELKLPTRTVFVRLIKALKSVKARMDEGRLDAFLKEAPTEFQVLARREMARFIKKILPQIKAPGSTADKLLNGDQPFFTQPSLDGDATEYDRQVAPAWHRVTHGEADDPAVLATVFFFVATGIPPKASMLLREGKEVIRLFRASGFDSKAVTDFIVNHAPIELQPDLQKLWEDDLKAEAEQQLADSDPNWPDAYMERSLEYLRKTCRAAWKSRNR
jgi:hypothetical protein